MKNNMRSLFFILIIFLPKFIFAQWIVQSAPSDNFSAVNFTSATNGLIVGHHGLYYTNNGGATWVTINPPVASVDSLVFRHTSFSKVSYASFYWLITGKDTIANKAVIFRLGYTSTICTLVYTGTVGSSLNDISFYGGTAFAAGDNNLLVNSINTGQTWNIYVTPAPIENYRSVATTGSATTLLGAPGDVYYKTTSGS
jgi:photosystem II stability/assembly factor-like uncharacterized protein